MRLNVLIIVACVSLLVGCAGLGTNINPGGGDSRSPARRAEPAFKLLYAFPNRKSGYLPYGSLFAMNGSLFGTTSDGGSECGSNGCGTVFSLSLKPSVKQTVLHSFANSPDGWTPYSGVTAIGDVIYGTTVRGGDYNGVVYGVDLKSGVETVVHAFQRSRDGRGPIGGMVAIGKTLYGTTGAGYDQHGAVFSIDNSGHETIVYRFKGRPDGAIPNGDLLAVGNVLYGTTKSGGSNPGKICSDPDSSGHLDCGTVFSITLGPSGPQEKVLYRFQAGANDGEMPQGGLIYVNGLLYGVTPYGGDGGCAGGCGTVFSVNPSTGQETVLHKFSVPYDGWVPVGNLAHFNGTLYGATYVGGPNEDGTVFSMKLDGSDEKILHSFAGGRKDGGEPEAGILLSDGILYGTTGFGGNGNCTNGCGTIYSITP
jgi:uncharacterized repeat protein (TIGR03803 family)